MKGVYDMSIIKDDNNGLKCRLCQISINSFEPIGEYSYISDLKDQFILIHTLCPICMVYNNDSKLILSENYLTMLAYALKQSKGLSLYKFSKLVGSDYKQIQSAVYRLKKSRDADELKKITLEGLKNQVLMLYRLISSFKMIDMYKDDKVQKKMGIDWDNLA